MLTLEERINVTELLSGLSEEDVLSIASTVTKGLLEPKTREEANEVILQHSDSVEGILNRKKVSRELIFKYLHWKKVTTDSNLDKKSLMNLLKDYWKAQLAVQRNIITEAGHEVNAKSKQMTQAASTSRNTFQLQNTTKVVSTALDPSQVDLFTVKFAEWFYQLLNKDFLEGGNFALGPQNFWTDAYVHMKLNANGTSISEEAEGSSAVVKLISVTKQQHKLYFSPNLQSEGVRGRLEPHGMVSILVCGTLHQSAGVVVGIFEQIFYLLKDPLMDNTWRIKRTLLNLTSNLKISALPTLSEGELTRPLLSIENPD